MSTRCRCASCAARSPFPPLTYYQLWHDLTHASAPARWLREQVRDVARKLAATACRAVRARDGGLELRHDDRRGASRCAATCSTSPADAGLGRRSSRRRCAAGPTTGCWSRTAASSARCSADAPDAGWAAPRPPRPADPARLHRHPRAQPAARRDRQLRHRAARLARTPTPSRPSARYADPAQARGRRGALPRRAAGARHDRGGGVPDRAQGRRPTRCSRAAQQRGMRLIAGKVLMDRHAPDGLRDDVDAGRARLPRADRALARPRPPRLRGDGALRADQHARAAGDGRRAVRAPTRASTCRPTWPRTATRCAGCASCSPRRAATSTSTRRAGLLQRAQRAGARHLARRRRPRRCCARAGAQIAHSPSSNLFLGSGLFDWRAARGGRRGGQPGQRRRRRHQPVDAAHDGRRLQGAGAGRPAADGLEGAARGHARRGARRSALGARDRPLEAGRAGRRVRLGLGRRPGGRRAAWRWLAACTSASSPG